MTEGLDDLGDLVEAAGFVVGEQNSQLVRLVGDSGSITSRRGIVAVLSFCAFAQWPLGSANRLVLGSIPRPDVCHLDQLADVSSTYGSPARGASVEHQTSPSAAVTVIGALVDHEHAPPSPTL
ncbi:MAG TPA: hypothetical protein VNA28_17840 [Solirubrobacteraceae bacterium]|nr:hypothetical protein [Solirubrobacteraceae bacterium]